MRHKHETATSFKELNEITQMIMQTQKTTLKPKASVKAKNHALNPTKKAFSERQITAFRDNSQDSANSSRETKASHNANALKPIKPTTQALRAEPSNEAFKPGLKNNQSKGGNDEA